MLLKKYLSQKDMLLKKFTHKTLLAFFAHEENRAKKDGNKISKSILAHIVTYFITAFKDAWKRDLIPYDLTKYITKPKVESHDKRFLQLEDYIKLLNMPNKDRRDALIKLDVLLGLRRSELVGLKYSDIDKMANTIFVHRKVLYSAQTGFDISSEMKTRSSKRSIYLNDHMWEKLIGLKQMQKATNKNCKACIVWNMMNLFVSMSVVNFINLMLYQTICGNYAKSWTYPTVIFTDYAIPALQYC